MIYNFVLWITAILLKYISNPLSFPSFLLLLDYLFLREIPKYIKEIGKISIINDTVYTRKFCLNSVVIYENCGTLNRNWNLEVNNKNFLYQRKTSKFNATENLLLVYYF